MVTNVYLLVIKQHTIHGFDGSLSSLGSLVVDVTVAAGSALLISGDLARRPRDCADSAS